MERDVDRILTEDAEGFVEDRGKAKQAPNMAVASVQRRDRGFARQTRKTV